MPFVDVEDTPEFIHNQKRNYERYLFVSNKYLAKKPQEGSKSKDEDQQRFNEEAELLDRDGEDNHTQRSRREQALT